jgi:hypothetical protein
VVPAPLPFAPVAVVPPPPPPIQPIPPSGGMAQSPSTAKREEKARKEASQSAYVIRPAGTPGNEWFYGVVGGIGILGIVLAGLGNGLRPQRRGARAAVAEVFTDAARRIPR